MIYQILIFSWKNKKNIHLSSAECAQRVVKVKRCPNLEVKFKESNPVLAE